MSAFAKQCPKCKMVYKYTNSIRGNCETCTKWGSPVELVEIPTPEDVRLTMDSHAKYCPKCGEYYKYEISMRDDCVICSTKLNEADFTNEDAWYGSGQAKDIPAWRKAVIETNPLFDKDANDRRIENVNFRLTIAAQSNEPKCPKCGSHNFQMVARNWSAMTGFFTNKVDRVCTRCKARF